MVIGLPKELDDYINELPAGYDNVSGCKPIEYLEYYETEKGEPLYRISMNNRSQVDFKNGRSARVMMRSFHEDTHKVYVIIPWVLYYSIHEDVGDYSVAYFNDGTAVISTYHWCCGPGFNLDLKSKGIDEKDFTDLFANGPHLGGDNRE